MAAHKDSKWSIGQRDDSFKLDAWNHLAMSYDGTNLVFFINGVQQGSRKVDQVRVPGKGDLVLSKGPKKRGPITEALYDQVRVWARALSYSELLAHSRNPAEIVDPDGLRYAETFDRYGVSTVLEPVWNDVTLRILTAAAGQWQTERHLTGNWTRPANS